MEQGPPDDQLAPARAAPPRGRTFVGALLAWPRRLARRRERDAREFTELFDAMVEGVVFQAASGEILRMNRAAAAILGVPAGSTRLAYGASFHVYDADGRELLGEELPHRTILRTGRPALNQTMSIERADGETRWLRVNLAPHRAVDGRGYVVCTFSDVTEQRQQQGLFHQIVNGTPDFIFIKDREHRYLVANDSYAAALGRAPADVVGRTDFDLGFPAVRVAKFHREANEVLTAGRTLAFDSEVVEVGGRARSYHTVKVPLFTDDATEPYGVLVFARDVSDLKEAERRLADASKMVSLGQMASGIAHEINNPLAIIGGHLTVMARQLDQGALEPEAARRAVDRMGATVERIAKIIRGLKALSRNGEHDPLELVLLREVIDDSLTLCEQRFHAHGVALTIDPVPDASMMGSATQLSQILVNLLNNAFDAVEPLGERWVRLTCVTDGPDRLTIAVTNAGPLIPAEVADKLMQPFFTTKPAGKGTGLGLALSRQIAERHGGTLTLDRRAGVTRFVVDLPRAA